MDATPSERRYHLICTRALSPPTTSHPGAPFIAPGTKSYPPQISLAHIQTPSCAAHLGCSNIRPSTPGIFNGGPEFTSNNDGSCVMLQKATMNRRTRLGIEPHKGTATECKHNGATAVKATWKPHGSHTNTSPSSFTSRSHHPYRNHPSVRSQYFNVEPEIVGTQTLDAEPACRSGDRIYSSMGRVGAEHNGWDTRGLRVRNGRATQKPCKRWPGFFL